MYPITRRPGQTIALPAAGICLLLAGCQPGSIDDLTAWVDAVNARPAVPVENVCAGDACAPWSAAPRYSGGEGRDPFAPVYLADEDTRPDPGRAPAPHPAEELEAYPLDALRMVGTLDHGAVRWGLVRAPDGHVHRVRPGNWIGRNNGKVVVISELGIALREVASTPSGWEEREAALALTETP